MAPRRKIQRWRSFGWSLLFLGSGSLAAQEIHPAPHPGLTDRPRYVPIMQAPPGNYLQAWRAAMADRADADTFVVYRNEWRDEGTVLGPYGRYHLDRIARRLPSVLHPVLIQTSGNEELDEHRRQFVVAFLAQMGIADGQTRVLVGFPLAEGLPGAEAAAVGLRRLGPGVGQGTSGGQGTGAFRGLGLGSGMGGAFGGFRGY